MRMKFKLLGLAFASICFVFGAGANPVDKNNYDFNYQFKGQASTNPIQVFDDGKNTFFQFPMDRNTPAIFVESVCGTKVLLNPIKNGNFHVVQNRFAKFILQMANKTSLVEYVGGNTPTFVASNDAHLCSDNPNQGSQINGGTAYSEVKPVLGGFPNHVPGMSAGISDVQNMSNSQVMIAPCDVSFLSPKIRKSLSKANLKKLSELECAKREKITSQNPSMTSTAAQNRALLASKVAMMNAQTNAQSLGAETDPKLRMIEVWEIKSGQSIRQCLDEWRIRAGWEMVWNYDGKFSAQASAKFEGNFESAVRSLVQALPDEMNMKIELTGNKLIYVTGAKK